VSVVARIHDLYEGSDIPKREMLLIDLALSSHRTVLCMKKYFLIAVTLFVTPNAFLF